MGLDSTYYPPADVRRSDLEDFLKLLGYVKLRSSKSLRPYEATSFHLFSKKPYESLQGVSFTVMIEDSNLVACGRNNIWRNKSDNDFHNDTLRQLRKRFGGYFVSDSGRNRYFPYDGINRKEADAGCRAAIDNSLSRLQELRLVSMALVDWQTPVQKGEMIWMNQHHPEVILANMCVAHILSVMENFFKDLYVAVLTFSAKKTDLIKTSQIRAADWADVIRGELRVEEAYANSLNFQNAKYICESFDKLDQDACVKQTLNKKISRRKETFFDFIERISSHRHEYLHHGEKRWDYDMSSLNKDTEFCKLMLTSIYQALAKKKHWHYEEPLF